MPALVVWERLVTAGDDLRLVTTCTLMLRLIQISMVIYVTIHLIRFDPHPDLFVLAKCIDHEEDYYRWHHLALACCFFTLGYGVIGIIIECAMFKISGRGTPTETHGRRHLVPLCKFNMVPMLLVRMAGFIFAIVALARAQRVCGCAFKNFPDELKGPDFDNVSLCPSNTRSWYVAVRLLIFTMTCDTIFPAITFLVVMKNRIYRCYRRIKPQEERDLEEVQRSWQMKCKRFCECSSLMTCYMCGGQKLTAGSYADVAIALTDFLDDGGSLDIVPSDIAAALICLVSIQKQKQITAKEELLKEGGVFAKDRRLATRLWRQMFTESNAPGGRVKKPEPKLEISSALKRSLSMSMSPKKNSTQKISVSDSMTSLEKADDIEAGPHVNNDHESDPTKLVLQYASLDQEWTPSEEKEEEDNEKSTVCSEQSTLKQPTDTELEQLRQMILTRKETMQRIDFRLTCANNIMSFEPTVSRLLSPEKPFDCLVLGEGSRYCQVALASYSWMMYMWTHKCTGCCQLTAGSVCSVCVCRPGTCCRSSDHIIGDDICGWKQASVLRSVGIEESDVLYANFSNDVSVNPYMILRDTKWETIVLTIRGTLSFEDMVSDVTISPQPLDEVGKQFGFDGRGEYCHSGMLAGAKWIYNDLIKHNILTEAMKANPHFGLRIVGHSLGAGVAAMLGLMLRQQFPRLYCLCFSPPGCVFSERTARKSEEYVCSYVLHNDIVPRLSYQSLVNFRNDLIEMIARIKVPKHKVFDANLRPWNEQSMLSLPEKLLYKKDEIPESQFNTDFERFKAKQSKRQEEREREHIEMTVPGRILQMVRTSAKLDNVPCSCLLSCAKCITCWEDTKKYKVRWTRAEDLSEIYISQTMMVDHFPYNVARALEVAADSYGIAEHASGSHHEHDQQTIIAEEVKKAK